MIATLAAAVFVEVALFAAEVVVAVVAVVHDRNEKYKQRVLSTTTSRFRVIYSSHLTLKLTLLAMAWSSSYHRPSSSEW